MCECCNIELTSAIRFRDRCIGAQRELLEGLTKQQLEQIPEKYKAAILGIDASPTPDNEQQVETESEPEADPSAEHEIESDAHQTEEDFLKFIPESSGTITKVKYEIGHDITEFIEADDDDDGTIVEEAQYECLLPDDDENVKIEEMPEQFIVPDPTEAYLYDSDDEVAVLDNVLDDEYEHENVVKKSSLPPKPKIKPDDPRRRGAGGVYICDQCGNHIKGRMAFELHCRRHRGEKDFQCE